MGPKVLFLVALLSIGLPARSASAIEPPSAPETPVVVGWIERVWLTIDGVTFSVPAKLDTGAKTASINAHDVRVFDSKDKRWVSFTIDSHDGQRIDIEAPFKRMSHVRRAGVEVSERPVVEMELCLAGIRASAEVSLTDRSGMNYQLLIGRRFLANRLLVDSSRKFIAPDLCAKAK